MPCPCTCRSRFPASQEKIYILTLCLLVVQEYISHSGVYIPFIVLNNRFYGYHHASSKVCQRPKSHTCLHPQSFILSLSKRSAVNQLMLDWIVGLHISQLLSAESCPEVHQSNLKLSMPRASVALTVTFRRCLALYACHQSIGSWLMTRSVPIYLH